MKEKVIKFYEEEISNEKIAKISENFLIPETKNYTVKSAKYPTFNIEHNEVRVACSRTNIYVRLDDLSKEIGNYIEVGDKLEVTTIKFGSEFETSAIVSFKNITKNVCLINVKLSRIADFIKEEVDKDKVSYKKMLSEIEDNDYLILLLQSYRPDGVELEDIVTAKSLNKSEENIRRMFSRNRAKRIVFPQSFTIGENKIENSDVFFFYVLQYNAENDGFSDKEKFYYNFLDIHMSLKIISEDISLKFDTLMEDL